MDRHAAVVRRQCRRHRAILLRGDAVVHGDPESTDLKCIAPYDGLIDVYRASAFSGGIPGEFFNLWYNQLLRPINQYPAHGPSRELPWDMPYVARHHTTYDEFWKERAAAEQLDKIKVPVYSIGLWTKVDLHLNGNIVGYQRIGAPKKLLLLGTSNLYAAVSDFSSVAFHEKFLLPSMTTTSRA